MHLNPLTPPHMEPKNAKKKVYAILEEYPQARNDDKCLVACYWARYQAHLLEQKTNEAGEIYLVVPLKNILKLDSEDKLSRIRRKIQNEEGRFWPTVEHVAQKRGIAMEHWRQWAAQKNDTL